jgi:hypothetical protein
MYTESSVMPHGKACHAAFIAASCALTNQDHAMNAVINAGVKKRPRNKCAVTIFKSYDL